MASPSTTRPALTDWTRVHTLTLDAREGETVATGDLALPTAVHGYVQRSFPEGIYRHQREAVELLLSGQDVCLATSTASGKTLAFTLGGLERITNDPSARVLALYPQRALAAEQEERWRRALADAGQPAHVCRIDGSVTSASRAALLRSARVVVATPDVLHSWFLSHSGDPAVRGFLRGLSLIVVDEVHTYTGVFGSNAAFLFRRLQHAIAQLGGSVRFFCASATIREPAQHLEKLFGRQFVVVGPERDSAPRQRVRVEFLCPPEGTDFLGALTEYLRALTTSTDERFLTFVDSRKQTEQIATILGRVAGDVPDDGSDEAEGQTAEPYSPLDSAHVLPYRSGYEERDRAAIQRRLSDGSLQGVVSTSALELGMDIPHLDTVVLVGVPRSSTSLQQRIGRVGRSRPGRVLVMHSGELLDEAVFAAPETLLERPPAEGALYLANPYIQYIHALCLARAGGEHEQAGGSSDPDVGFTSPVPWPEGFIELCQAERIGQIPAELQPMKSEAGDTPHYTFPLRDVEPQFQIEHTQGPHRRSLGSVSYSQALRETYPGAIYYYTAQPFRVLSVSPGTHKVVVRPDRHYHTQATRMTTCVFPNLSAGNVFSALEYNGTLRAIECNLQIREAVIGLKERRGSAETSYTYPLTGLPSGVMYAQPRFTRNYFTTGVLLTHPALLAGGALEEVMTLLFEALLMVAPYERQDLGSAVDHIRAENDIVPRDTQFAAIHGQTLYPGRSFWDKAERIRIADVCRRYARRTSRPRWPLGFGDAFAMIVLPYGVPNNTPAILWAGNGDKWQALFEERTVTSAQVTLLEQVKRDPAGTNLEEVLRRLGQLRLAGRRWDDHTTPEYRMLVLLLAIAARGFRDARRMAEIMEMEQERCLTLIGTARQFGFLDDNNTLTQAGAQELSYARVVGRERWEPAPLAEDRFYYPMTLREGQRSI